MGIKSTWEAFSLDIVRPTDPWNGSSAAADPAKWEQHLNTVLTKIQSTDAGTALLQSIRRMAQWIDIHPLPKVECNAHGGFPGTRVRGGRWYQGQVQYDPDVYMSGSDCYKRAHRKQTGRAFAFLPDEVLFHELVHAHRAASWLVPNHDRLIAGLSGYKDEEEFLAVVLTNIYISDKTNHGSSGLRRDYFVRDRPLEEKLSTSLGFYQSSPQVLRILKKFRQDQGFLFDKLAKVNGSFNPLVALRDAPDEVEKMAYSKLAMEREKTVPSQAARELAQRDRANRETRERDAREFRAKLDRGQLVKEAEGIARILAEDALKVLRLTPIP